jgi:hypothetical protein
LVAPEFLLLKYPRLDHQKEKVPLLRISCCAGNEGCRNWFNFWGYVKFVWCLKMIRDGQRRGIPGALTCIYYLRVTNMQRPV